jgi:tetratricopeptide (TPR) repeat protein
MLLRSRFTFIGVLLLLLSIASAQTRQDQIAAAIRDQQFDSALSMLRAALKESPSNAQLWTMQGVAYQGQGHTEEALSSFRRAIQLSPNNIPALQKAAQLEFDAESPAGIPLLERLLRLRPDDLTTHGMLAVLQYQKGDCEQAAVHFQRAAAIFEAKLPALHAWGACLVKLRHYEVAEGVFQKSLLLNPSDPRERQILASVELTAHDPGPALITLEPLLTAHPDGLSLELASSAYEDLHNTERAVDMLRQAILLDSRNVSLYVDFAALSATHQSFQVGIDVVNDGINLQPNAAPLYFARGVLYVQLADYQKAQTDFEKAYELDPHQSLSVAAQGLAAAQRSDLPQALSDVEKELTHRPDDPVLLYVQADILTQEGVEPGSPDFGKAMRSARRAVALRPSLGPAHSVLAKLYLQSGQFADAAAQCRKALEIDPKDQTALYHLIQATRRNDPNHVIPELLKRLASLRAEAVQKERQQYRFKLIEDGDQSQ